MMKYLGTLLVFPAIWWWAGSVTSAIPSSAEPVNVMDLGAKCDGKTMDTDAFLRGIAIASSVGGELSVPASDRSRPCLFNSTLVLNKVRLIGHNSVLKFVGSHSIAIRLTAPVPMYSAWTGIEGPLLLLNGGQDNKGLVVGPAFNAQVHETQIEGFEVGVYTHASYGPIVGFRMEGFHLNNRINVDWEAGAENIVFENGFFDHLKGEVSTSRWMGGKTGEGGPGYISDFQFWGTSWDGDVPTFINCSASVHGGHFEPTASGGTYFATVGDGASRAALALFGTTLGVMPAYSFPQNTFFRVRRQSRMDALGVRVCSVLHPGPPAVSEPFRLMILEPGASGTSTDLFTHNCADYPSPQGEILRESN
jgi:hypothetical protein